MPVEDRIVVSACHYVSGPAQTRDVAAPPAGPSIAVKRVHWGPRIYEFDTATAPATARHATPQLPPSTRPLPGAQPSLATQMPEVRPTPAEEQEPAMVGEGEEEGLGAGDGRGQVSGRARAPTPPTSGFGQGRGSSRGVPMSGIGKNNKKIGIVL